MKVPKAFAVPPAVPTKASGTGGARRLKHSQKNFNVPVESDGVGAWIRVLRFARLYGVRGRRVRESVAKALVKLKESGETG